MADVVNAILNHQSVSNPPAYGISIDLRGTAYYCTLIDKHRKVIVTENIRSLHSESGDWYLFMTALREALGKVKTLTAEGTAFGFVVEGTRSRVI